jgi:hypothetical protein
MATISRHMFLIYCALCMNMFPPSWFGGSQGALQRGSPRPPSTAQICLQYKFDIHVEMGREGTRYPVHPHFQNRTLMFFRKELADQIQLVDEKEIMKIKLTHRSYKMLLWQRSQTNIKLLPVS